VVLVVAAAAAALLLADRGDVPSGGGVLAQDEFTATSPWRLVIRDNITDMNNGCDVTVTHIASGEQLAVPLGIYGSDSFQIRKTGRFRWNANDPGCLVIYRPGAGKAVLPFAPEWSGDTDAFDTSGPVAVEVVDFHGNSECEFELHDAADGQQLDFGSVREGGSPLRLDPSGRSQVYVSNLHCGIRVSAGY
jgi:eukaryotic-like serine/threonine-protein kinase